MGLDEIVDDYEQRFADDSQVRLEDFVPSPGDPNRSEVLAELIRVDLELRWKKGVPRALADYRARFPEEFQSEGFLAPLAFEEYRVRLLLGDSVKRSEYAEHWGCDVSDWPDESVGSRRGAAGESSGRSGVVRGGGKSDPLSEGPAGRSVGQPGSAISRAAVSGGPLSDLSDGSSQRGGEARRRGGRISPKPDPVGQAIFAAQSELGVEIVEQLGRGASARVYLARQPSLANRLVVLKFTTESTVEADRLARLQHTNIVPLYSYHELGEMHVLCMPFLGRYVLKEWVDQLHVQGVAPDDNISLLTTVRTQAAGSRDLAGPDPGDTRSNLLESRDSVDSVDQRYLETTSRLVRDPSREAGLLKLKGGKYCDTVLWVAGRLASGMAHAHDHGILHLDIKPGNILITDEGQPMLLDFHLSTLSHSSGLDNPVVGGTLPYMSPEQILAFRDRASVDERSDIYSLGVVLYELMTGRLPFVTGRSGTSWDDLQRMLEVRTQVPALREHNRQVSPAAESIVRHCLAYRPEDRYQSAHELAHDLHSHLQHLPLQHALNPSVRELVSKWVRRHPRVMSAGGIGTVSVIGLGILGTTAALRGHKLAETTAQVRFEEFAEQARKTSSRLSLVKNNFAEATREIDQSVELLSGLGFPVRRLLTIPAERLGNETEVQPAWRSTVFYQLLSTDQREHLENSAAEMLFLIAEVVSHRQDDSNDQRALARKALQINLLGVSCFPPGQVPAAIWEQRARFYRLIGEPEQAEQARLQAEAHSVSSAIQERLEGLSHLILQNQEAAADSLARLTNRSPQDLSLWFFSGNNQLSGHLLDEAEASYTACIALSPKWHLGWWQRGTIRLMGKQYQKAYDDYTVAHELDPANLETLRNRALCLEALGRFDEAIDDCTKAIQQGFSQTRIYFLRSRLFERQGRIAEAEVDRREGLTRTPTDVESWIVRGVARMAEDPTGAEQDFREAIRWDPENSAAHRNLALVLVEHLGRESEALEVLDEFLKISRVDDGLVWLGRGVLRARKGELAAAREDARRGLALNRQPIAVYQAACIEALDPNPSMDGLRRTIDLLTESFRADPSLIAVAIKDGDLKYIQDKRLFKDLVSLMRFVSPKD